MNPTKTEIENNGNNNFLNISNITDKLKKLEKNIHKLQKTLQIKTQISVLEHQLKVLNDKIIGSENKSMINTINSPNKISTKKSAEATESLMIGKQQLH